MCSFDRLLILALFTVYMEKTSTSVVTSVFLYVLTLPTLCMQASTRKHCPKKVKTSGHCDKNDFLVYKYATFLTLIVVNVGLFMLLFGFIW